MSPPSPKGNVKPKNEQVSPSFNIAITKMTHLVLAGITAKIAMIGDLKFDIKLTATNWSSWLPAFKRTIGYRAPVIVEGFSAEQLQIDQEVWVIINDRGIGHIQAAISPEVSDSLPETTPGDAFALFVRRILGISLHVLFICL